MQYEIALPADYDMQIVRERVATRGGMLDAFAGLGLKAYLVRERGVYGSPVNAYAPFYLWTSTEQMATFLWGGAGFAGLVMSFGRPRVLHWTGVAVAGSAEDAGAARIATRRLVHLSPDGDPAPEIAALARLPAEATRAGATLAAAAVDPATWTAVLFALWDRPPPQTTDTVFTVLHVSRPELPALLAGTGGETRPER